MLKHTLSVDRARVLELIDRAVAGQCRIELSSCLEPHERAALQAQLPNQKVSVILLHGLYRDVASTAEWLDLGGVDDEPFESFKRQCRFGQKPPRVPTRNVILRFGLPGEQDLVLLVRRTEGKPDETSVLILRFELAIRHAETVGAIILRAHPGKLETLYCPPTQEALASTITLHDALHYLEQGGWS